MASEAQNTEERAEEKAPEVLHKALDVVFRWMVDNAASDGMVTIKVPRENPEEKPLAIDLMLVAYYEAPGDEREGEVGG